MIMKFRMQMGAIVETYGLTEAVVEAVKAGVDMILLANQIPPKLPPKLDRIVSACIGFDPTHLIAR